MNLANSKLLVKDKATGTPLEMYYIRPYRLLALNVKVPYKEFIYIRVGLSALLVWTNRAMREPIHSGTSDRTGSTFFVSMLSFLLSREQRRINFVFVSARKRTWK